MYMSFMFSSCVHREKCVWVSAGSRGWGWRFKLSAASCRQHKNTLYSSRVFQVAEVSHRQDGVVLPGVFGVVPLQETPARGAARPSKLGQVQVSKAQLQENTRQFEAFGENLTWTS